MKRLCNSATLFSFLALAIFVPFYSVQAEISSKEEDPDIERKKYCDNLFGNEGKKVYEKINKPRVPHPSIQYPSVQEPIVQEGELQKPFCFPQNVPGKLKIIGTPEEALIACVPDTHVGGSCTPGSFIYSESLPSAPYQLYQVNKACTYYYECCFTIDQLIELLCEIQEDDYR